VSRNKLFSILGALVALLLAWSLLGGEGNGDDTVVRGARATRGPLRISVVERGNLSAANSIDYKSEIERQTTILWLVEEGTVVGEGDLLVDLDVSDIEDKRIQQELTVKSAEASHNAAEQKVEIQVSQNQSDLDSAARAVEFAEIDLEKYLEGDWPQQLKDAEDAILLAVEEHERAKDKLDWSTTLFEKEFLTRSELEADELAATRAKLKVAQEQRKLELLKAYDHPKQKKSLEADLEEARREQERIRLRAEARLVEYRTDLETKHAKLVLEQEQLAKIEEQLTKGKIHATVGGMVVYAREGGGRWRQGEPMAEGTAVRERQKIVTIPVTEGMLAEVSLHESVLGKVVEGMPCRLEVDALPGRTFDGVVKFKSALPDQNSWFANPNQRLYRTEVAITGSDVQMRPGMTCSVEFLVGELEDAIQVPLQAVFRDGEDMVCFVANGSGHERRVVEVGESNHELAEIQAGIEEGETVLLSLPAGTTLAPAPRSKEPGGTDGEEDAPPQRRGPPRGAPAADAAKRPGGAAAASDARR
jgi:HlyD family secretion protein